MLTIFWVYATSNLLSIQSVDNQTVLTANLWNDTMSALTWAITDLDQSVVKLTGNQTIAGVKTFSSPIWWVTPVWNSDLATKNYVDARVSAAASGWWEPCPTQITALSWSYATLSAAMKACRDMWSWYRIPTFTELSCFINDTSIPWWATWHSLWTRESDGNNPNYYKYLSLSSWNWWRDSHTNISLYYRCVR